MNKVNMKFDEDVEKFINARINYHIKKNSYLKDYRSDLLSEAYMAFIQAKKNYDPSLSSFNTYLSKYIDKYIYEYIRKNNLIVVPQNINSLKKMYEEDMSTLIQDLKRTITREDILKYYPDKYTIEIIDMIESNSFILSTFEDAIESSLSYEENILSYDFEDIKEKLNVNDRELKAYLMKIEGLSLKEIGKEFNISYERARQLIKKVEIKIKLLLENE